MTKINQEREFRSSIVPQPCPVWVGTKLLKNTIIQTTDIDKQAIFMYTQQNIYVPSQLTYIWYIIKDIIQG